MTPLYQAIAAGDEERRRPLELWQQRLNAEETAEVEVREAGWKLLDALASRAGYVALMDSHGRDRVRNARYRTVPKFDVNRSTAHWGAPAAELVEDLARCLFSYLLFKASHPAGKLPDQYCNSTDIDELSAAYIEFGLRVDHDRFNKEGPLSTNELDCLLDACEEWLSANAPSVPPRRYMDFPIEVPAIADEWVATTRYTRHTGLVHWYPCPWCCIRDGPCGSCDFPGGVYDPFDPANCRGYTHDDHHGHRMDGDGVRIGRSSSVCPRASPAMLPGLVGRFWAQLDGVAVLPLRAPPPLPPAGVVGRALSSLLDQHEPLSYEEGRQRAMSLLQPKLSFDERLSNLAKSFPQHAVEMLREALTKCNGHVGVARQLLSVDRRAEARVWALWDGIENMSG